MLEGTINIIQNFGEIGVNLLDSAGTLLVTFLVLWIVYTIITTAFNGAKKIWNGNKK